MVKGNSVIGWLSQGQSFIGRSVSSRLVARTIGHWTIGHKSINHKSIGHITIVHKWIGQIFNSHRTQVIGNFTINYVGVFTLSALWKHSATIVVAKCSRRQEIKIFALLTTFAFSLDTFENIAHGIMASIVISMHLDRIRVFTNNKQTKLWTQNVNTTTNYCISRINRTQQRLC